MTPSPSPSAPASSGGQQADGWSWFDEWLASAGSTLTNLGIILGLALVVWVIGQVVIHGIVRGIAKAPDWGREQAMDVLVRVKLTSAEEESLEERLADERREGRAKTIGSVLRAALNVVIVTISLLMVLGEFGVDIAPVLASAGIVGVALGFGAQSLVKDLLSGVFMLIEDQFGVGDVIDVGEASGSVEEVGLRITRLRSIDGTAWYIPNGEIRRVGNMTQTWSRVMIDVRFAYATNIDEAIQAMLDAVERARADEEIAAAMVGEPGVAGVEAMDYNAVMLRLLQQVKPVTQWSVMRAIRQHMRDIFMERGIRLAAPEGSLIQSKSKSPTKTRKSVPARKASTAPDQGDS